VVLSDSSGFTVDFGVKLGLTVTTKHG